MHWLSWAAITCRCRRRPSGYGAPFRRRKPALEICCSLGIKGADAPKIGGGNHGNGVEDFPAGARRLARRLGLGAGARFSPPGLGARSHLMNDAIDLDTHVADIVNFIKWEGLADVVLCGHSYGGMVISGVAEQVLPAISSILFLAAFVPDNGEAMVDIAAPA